MGAASASSAAAPAVSVWGTHGAPVTSRHGGMVMVRRFLATVRPSGVHATIRRTPGTDVPVSFRNRTPCGPFVNGETIVGFCQLILMAIRRLAVSALSRGERSKSCASLTLSPAVSMPPARRMRDVPSGVAVCQARAVGRWPIGCQDEVVLRL
ncbi:hypothetical protein AKJ09_10966 [Labilithrix luteola]|uniref:Uncharacterized protein n=1 Tax=Labilithrix luteola TaxID=1391654 RepID=A0A0K1QF04_9BACT|nr:hypothetical protein AKJ09_10966 [Labilithrix luteola]